MNRTTLWILFLMNALCGFAQTKDFVIPDSLKGKTYEALRNGFDKSMDHFDTANLYAQTYLKKAEKNKEFKKIFNGLSMLIQLNASTQEAVNYCDQLIQLGKTYQNDTCMAEGYYQKGGQLYYLSNYKEAFDNYLKANEIFKKKNMLIKQLDIKHGIGLLKNEMNQPREALVIFKNNYHFYREKTMKTKYQRKYLITLLALGDTYNRLEIQDSSAYYTAIGIAESLKKDPSIYPHFLVSYGISKYHTKAYQNSLDSLLKGVQQFSLNNSILCDTYLVISDDYTQLKKTAPSIDYLKKIDSIFEKDPSVYSQALSANKKLLDYYTTHPNLNLQLQTAHKILVLDSISKKNNENVSQQIVSEYEMPLLLNEKDNIISKLNTSNHWFQNVIAITVFLLGIVAFLGLRNYRKSQKDLLKYKSLMDQLNEPKTEPEKPKNSTDKELSDDTFETIRISLATFEKEKIYRDTTLNLQTFSKLIQTNSTYLSRYINQVYGKSLTAYLSDLRINDALYTLKTDSKIRNYTIKAISEHFGFNNPETFSKEFLKKTGIYPSFFIRKLKHEN